MITHDLEAFIQIEANRRSEQVLSSLFKVLSSRPNYCEKHMRFLSQYIAIAKYRTRIRRADSAYHTHLGPTKEELDAVEVRYKDTRRFYRELECCC